MCNAPAPAWMLPWRGRASLGKSLTGDLVARGREALLAEE